MSIVPVELVKKRIVYISISPSVVRGQKSGTMKEIINYLVSINLENFSKVKDEKNFNHLLDMYTNEPGKKIKCWGIARKAINIFLFQASHDIVLNRKYNLNKIIPYLELILDNNNAKKLVKYAKQKGINLEWEKIKSLDKKTNKKFQKVAKKYAHEEYKCERCYLEFYLWHS